MKKNRNCGGGTMYPNFNQGMPMMGIPTPIMAQQQYPQPYQSMVATPYSQTYNNVEQQINNLEQRLNSLENRVSKLESKTTNSTSYNNKYNDSNYYML